MGAAQLERARCAHRRRRAPADHQSRASALCSASALRSIDRSIVGQNLQRDRQADCVSSPTCRLPLPTDPSPARPSSWGANSAAQLSNSHSRGLRRHATSPPTAPDCSRLQSSALTPPPPRSAERSPTARPAPPRLGSPTCACARPCLRAAPRGPARLRCAGRWTILVRRASTLAPPRRRGVDRSSRWRRRRTHPPRVPRPRRRADARGRRLAC
eukprot:SAG11_NODE_12616_length_694_cov_1.230252_1_plen_213_part_10